MITSPLVQRVNAWLRDRVEPIAHELDHDSARLGEVLHEMGEQGWLALRRPLEYGGPNLNERDFRWFQEAIARTSGALAFLQTQHQSAVSMLAHCPNESLKMEVLPRMGDGQLRMGIGFSQLRRSGPPLLRATEVPGGYQLDGHLPWITGRGFFDQVLVAGELPDGSSVFGLIPFQNTQGPHGGMIALSDDMELAAMGSARTVTADLTGWRLPEDRVAFKRPPKWIHTNDVLNIALQGYFAVGCAQGSLDEMERRLPERLPEVRDAWRTLNQELEACRQGLYASDTGTEPDVRLRLRAWAIDLAVRCAHAAIATTGGSANRQDSPVQRRYREALVYTVSAQTVAVQVATVQRLAASRATNSGSVG